MSTSDAPSLRADAIATATVALFSFVAALVHLRVFEDRHFVIEALLIVVAGHGTSLLLRRVRAPMWAWIPAMVGIVAVVVLNLRYGDTTVFGLPTGLTIDAFVEDIARVRESFPIESAPVAYLDGWATLMVLGTALVVILSDVFAFAGGARVEVLVPGALLFGFVSILGDGGGGEQLAVLLVGAGILGLIALRHRELDGVPIRTSIASESPRRAHLGTASIGTAVCVALLAATLGPRLPGADAPALYEPTGRTSRITEVLSPLVDIRSRLVDLSEQEVFRVRADQDSYWRLTTLPQFDGQSFRLPTRPLQRVEGLLESPGGSAAATTPIRQEIEIVNLAGRLIPAAAEPEEASGRELRWNPDTATLVVVGGDLVRGDQFSILSGSPRVQPSELRGARTDRPIDPVHLEVPGDLPSVVTELATSVTAGAPTAYDAALALQSWFRAEFTYSIEVPPGHGGTAIEIFLQQRIGYCEQFSATFAAMARTLDIPSRVAVGYTAGDRLPDGTFSVKGRHAHAWPELWFGELGWIAFEPTPGRGAPGTEQYTGIAAQQDTTVPEDIDESDEAVVEEPDIEDSEPDLSMIPDFADPTLGQSGAETPAANREADASRSWTALMVIALAALGLTAPAALRRMRRARLQRLPDTARIRVAWSSAVRAAQRGGVVGRASMTPSEWATATGRVIPVAARPMESLAAAIDALTFAPPGRVDLTGHGPLGTSLPQECARWSRQIRSIVQDRTPWNRRLWAYFADLD